jgi:hypothetical protein
MCPTSAYDEAQIDNRFTNAQHFQQDAFLGTSRKPNFFVCRETATLVTFLHSEVKSLEHYRGPYFRSRVRDSLMLTFYMSLFSNQRTVPGPTSETHEVLSQPRNLLNCLVDNLTGWKVYLVNRRLQNNKLRITPHYLDYSAMKRLTI